MDLSAAEALLAPTELYNIQGAFALPQGSVHEAEPRASLPSAQTTGTELQEQPTPVKSAGVIILPRNLPE